MHLYMKKDLKINKCAKSITVTSAKRHLFIENCMIEIEVLVISKSINSSIKQDSMVVLTFQKKKLNLLHIYLVQGKNKS